MTHYCLDEIWQNVSEELSVKTNLDLDASLVAQRLKHLPAMQESWVQSLSWEDPLAEGNGNPLQYSCLENPMGRGAWWASPWGRRVSHDGVTDHECMHVTVSLE